MTVIIKENFDWLSKERELWNRGFRYIAGVDEAGRGPLAGPVVAAAVILDRSKDLSGIIDSKKLTASQRESAFALIMDNCLDVAVSASSVSVIDSINILKATMLAMKRSISRLKLNVDYVLVDGNRMPDNLQIPGEAIIGGDGLCRSIAAASIVAKVTRDRLMINLDRLYPGYGFSQHKGYGTEEHIKVIDKLGPTPHHRYSFAPVRQHNLHFDND